MENIIYQIIMNSGIIVAIIAATSSIIISIINFTQLSKQQKNTVMTETQKFRYTTLYEILLKWKGNNSNNEMPENIDTGTTAMIKLIELSSETDKVWIKVKPLINPRHIQNIDMLYDEHRNKFGIICFILANHDSNNFMDKTLFDEWFKSYEHFEHEVENAIINQLSALLLVEEDC